MPRWTHRREALLSAVLALMALAAALASQHIWDMQPCPWCVLQRLIFAVGAAVALVEAAGLTGTQARAATGWRMTAGLRALLASMGLAAALWQHFVASSSASCALTLADRVLAATRLDGLLPDIFQPRASCLEAKVSLLGVPYEWWSAGLFVILAGLALRSASGRQASTPFRATSKA